MTAIFVTVLDTQQVVTPWQKGWTEGKEGRERREEGGKEGGREEGGGGREMEGEGGREGGREEEEGGKGGGGREEGDGGKREEGEVSSMEEKGAFKRRKTNQCTSHSLVFCNISTCVCCSARVFLCKHSCRSDTLKTAHQQ